MKDKALGKVSLRVYSVLSLFLKYPWKHNGELGKFWYHPVRFYLIREQNRSIGRWMTQMETYDIVV